MPRAVKRSQGSDIPTDWNQVIAKALAYLAVNSEQMKAKNLTERGAFLLSLGLRYEDAAQLLGSTEASLRELLRLAKKAKNAKARPSRSTRDS